MDYIIINQKTNDMKDWKTWVLLLGIYFLVKMCGGCEGCDSSSNSDSGEVSSEFKRALEIRLIGKYNAENPHITTIERISENPSTYRFEFEFKDKYGVWQHRTAHCSFWEDGELKDIY